MSRRLCLGLAVPIALAVALPLWAPGAGAAPARSAVVSPLCTKLRTADPIFSKPYEPGSASAGAPKTEAPREAPKRKQPQRAALLGGLKRA